MTLKEEVLKNSGFSGPARTALAAWMESIETALAEHKTVIEDIDTQYTAHCADDTAHNSADTTNATSESISTEVTTITDA